MEDILTMKTLLIKHAQMLMPFFFMTQAKWENIEVWDDDDKKEKNF